VAIFFPPVSNYQSESEFQITAADPNAYVYVFAKASPASSAARDRV
jgi:hypothetical protein